MQREHIVHGRAIRDGGIDVHIFRVTRAACKTRAFELGVVIVVEVVDADHLVAARQQTPRKGGADEPGRAGNDDFHGSLV